MVYDVQICSFQDGPPSNVHQSLQTPEGKLQQLPQPASVVEGKAVRRARRRDRGRMVFIFVRELVWGGIVILE